MAALRATSLRRSIAAAAGSKFEGQQQREQPKDCEGQLGLMFYSKETL